MVGSEVSIEVEYLLDEDHEAVDVEFYDFGQEEVNGGAQEFENAYQEGRGLLAERLEQSGGQVQDRQDAAVAQVVQLDLLRNRGPEHRVDRLQRLHRPQQHLQLAALLHQPHRLFHHLTPLPRIILLRHLEYNFSKCRSQLRITHIPNQSCIVRVVPSSSDPFSV